MRRLRIEPYDPNAVDGDGDGIVQEGTAWERPVGTRLVDSQGNAFRTGSILTQRPSLSVVDASGRAVAYVPSYERRREGQRLSTLGSLGYLSLSEQGVTTVRPMGTPTLADRGYLTIGQIYGRGVVDSPDPMMRIFLQREELLNSLSPEQVAEHNRITDFIAGIVNNSSSDEETKSRLFAILEASALWASHIFRPLETGDDASRRSASRSMGVLPDDQMSNLRWLQDITALGGREAFDLAIGLGNRRREQDSNLLADERRLISELDVPEDSTMPTDLQSALRDAFPKLTEFMAPNNDGEIRSQRLSPDEIPDADETISSKISRLGSKPIDINSTATGLPFYVNVADILVDAPNGYEAMQTVLDFFNRRYDEDLSIDDVRRILDAHNNGESSEFFDRRINHFFALLLQHDSIKSYVKRRNAERLAARIGPGLGQVELSDEGVEQLAKSLFSRSDGSLQEGRFIPKLALAGIFPDGIPARHSEVWPGQALDDEIIMDLFAWSVFNARPDWTYREDLNPVFAMMFRDRPHVLKNNESFGSPLMLVPSLLMPTFGDDDPLASDKNTLNSLISNLIDSDAMTQTKDVIGELRDAERLMASSAYGRLAKRLNDLGSTTGGPINVSFLLDRSAEPLGAQLLNLIRDEGFSDEQMELISSFLGFNPLDDERYHIFFSNPDAPTTLAPRLPSPVRQDVIDAGFLSEATVFEYMEDVGQSLPTKPALSEDGNLQGHLASIFDALDDSTGTDSVLLWSLLDYADGVSLSSRDPDSLRRLGYVEGDNGREALVASMEFGIKQWQQTANDANPRSLAIQEIAEEEFGLSGTYSLDDFYESSGLDASLMKDLIRVVRENEGETLRAFVRSQYADTQEMLESMGIERIGIVRGFTMPESHPDFDNIKSLDDTVEGEDLNVLGIDAESVMRPLSSWSTDTATAVRFAKNVEQLDEDRKEVIVVAEVPREQVFGTAVNGNGALDEYEVVLLGQPTQTRMFSSDVAQRINTDDTVPEDTEGGLDSEWLNLEVPDPRFADTSIPASITSIEVDELDVTTPSPNLDDVRDSATRELRSTPRRASREVSQNPELTSTLESLVAVDVFSETAEFEEIFRWYDGLDINDPELDPDYITEEHFERAREIAQVFEDTLEIKDGKTVDITPTEIAVNTGSVEVSGEFFIGDQYAGRFSRTFFKQEGEDSLWVLHEVLFLEKDVQQLGIGRAFTSRWEEIYKSHGVSKILTNGASHRDNRWRGASHWPKQGFDWLNADSREQFFEYLELIPGSEEMLGLSREELATRVPRGVFVEGLSEGEPPSGDLLFDTPYFESVDSWVEFWETFKRARDEDFDDPYRVIPAELLAWAGADAFLMKHHAEVMYQKGVK